MPRKPKPPIQSRNEGDPRKLGKHKLDQRIAAEPKATTGYGPCPEHLTGRARDNWEFWTTELAIMQLNKKPDGPMLEGACVAYARAVEADIAINTEGLWKDGKKHPLIETSFKAWDRVRAFCSEFGLSPVSRTRLSVAKLDDGEDDLLKLLATPRPRKEDPPLTVQ